MLIAASVAGLPFILHLRDCFAGIVAFPSGRVLTHKLSLAGKERLATTMVCHSLFGHKMAASKGILKGNACKTKHNFIIAKEHWCIPLDTIVLDIGQLMVRGTQDRSGLVTPNDRRQCSSVWAKLKKSGIVPCRTCHLSGVRLSRLLHGIFTSFSRRT